MDYIDADAETYGGYRYWLRRAWDCDRPVATWCMLNPSTATGAEDDPTVRKCVGFSDRWGYGGIRIINLFALVSSDPKALLEPGADLQGRNLFLLSSFKGPLIVAWGAAALRVPGYQTALRALLQDRGNEPMVCLGTTRNHQPRHPGRIGYATVRIPWKPPT